METWMRTTLGESSRVCKMRGFWYPFIQDGALKEWVGVWFGGTSQILSCYYTYNLESPRKIDMANACLSFSRGSSCYISFARYFRLARRAQSCIDRHGSN